MHLNNYITCRHGRHSSVYTKCMPEHYIAELSLSTSFSCTPDDFDKDFHSARVTIIRHIYNDIRKLSIELEDKLAYGDYDGSKIIARKILSISNGDYNESQCDC